MKVYKCRVLVTFSGVELTRAATTEKIALLFAVQRQQGLWLRESPPTSWARNVRLSI